MKQILVLLTGTFRQLTFLGLLVISIARVFIEEQIKEIEERTHFLENDPKCDILAGGNG